MRPRSSLVLALTACVIAAPATGSADTLHATRGQPLREARHDVAARVGDGVVRYVVTRAFRNLGSRHEEAIVEIDLPPFAVATALRIRRGERWYEGELLPADKAADRYEELTGLGAWTPRDPALLAWQREGSLSLQVFPVEPGGTATVQYELLAPTAYAHGRVAMHYADVSAEQQAEARAGEALPLVAPTVRVLGAEGARVVVHRRETLDADERPGCGPLGAAEPSPWIHVDLPGPPIETVAARYATHRVSDDHALLRLELDAAARLGETPRGARVVFVLDASRSQGAAGVEAQVALARAFLRHVPDAEVEVVSFRREARRLFGEALPAPQALEQLAGLRATDVEQGNGSDLARGLALAAEALEGAGGPRRVVLTTDGALRTGFDPAEGIAALRAAPWGTVVHVVLRDGRSGDDLPGTRDDAHELAPLAAAYEGMLMSLQGGSGDALAEAVLPLVRPVRIDGFSVVAQGDLPDVLDLPDTLEEGVAHRRMTVVGAAPPALLLQGRIWGRPWARRVGVSPSAAARLPALAFGDVPGLDLPDEDLEALATEARVVSPYTSYLAIEPGVRPSTQGIDRGLAMSGFGIGCACGGVGRGYSIRRGIAYADPVDYEGLLAEAMRRDLGRCGGPAAVAGATVRFETTWTEVVDVAVEGVPEAAARCAAEVAWAVELPGVFRFAQSDWTVAL